MSDADYPGCINELYQSEVLGEAAFLALMKAARSERDRYQFGTFLQLETETKARLRPFLLKHGLELDESQGGAEAVAMGPEEDKAILDSMVLHEESFVHWIEKELAGESGGLDAALSQIENPLPVP